MLTDSSPVRMLREIGSAEALCKHDGYGDLLYF